MSQFDHEKLNVYQASIKFVLWADAILIKFPNLTLFTINSIELQRQSR